MRRGSVRVEGGGDDQVIKRVRTDLEEVYKTEVVRNCADPTWQIIEIQIRGVLTKWSNRNWRESLTKRSNRTGGDLDGETNL